MHKAIIVKVDRVAPIQGADRIQVAFVLGEAVVVSKDINVHDIGIFFPVDIQLSEEYCYQNNLFREKEKNLDQTKAGYFENSRRIRAQPFKGVKSCGLFMPLSSLDYTGLSVTHGTGFQFDKWNGQPICQKYISEKAQQAISNGKTKQSKSNLYPTFLKHVDSEQFKHFASSIQPGSLLSFHAKIHGTSFRVGKVKKVVKLNWFQKLLNKLGGNIQEYRYEQVVGTRNVVIEYEEKEGFHGSEAFRFEVANELSPFLEDGMTIYGEIAGYANGKPIMPNGDVKSIKDKQYIEKYGKTNVFSYGCKEHEYRWHIYRITRESVDGSVVDMSAKQVEKWAADRGFLATFQVYPQEIYFGDEERLRSVVEYLTERPEVLTEDYINPNQIGEGVIIRADYDGDTPKFYKSKSFAFRAMEGLVEVPDMESVS